MAETKSQRGPTRRMKASLAGVLLIMIVVYLHPLAALLDTTVFDIRPHTTPWTKAHQEENNQLPNISGLQDLVLVVKTGATESLRKLPVHFNTTLRRWPNVLLLSDFNEQVDGHPVHDALDIISESIRAESSSFELWRRLREQGRSGLSAFDPESGEQIQWFGTSSDRQDGWRLARFMNLPMAVKAKQYKPDAKWYIFVDADTSISWSNTLRLVEQLDHLEPLYVGSQVAMGTGEFFAHGGSGYVLSQAALNKVTELYQSQQEHWDAIAEAGEFGEVSLARALMAADIHLTWAFPHFQGGQPQEMDFGFVEHSRKVWCYPAITYHHLNDEDIQSLSDFEDEWMKNNNRPFRHSDVFKQWVLPAIHRNSGVEWDNIADSPVEDVADEVGCRAACLKSEQCFQYSFTDQQCRIETGHPKIGRRRPGSTAGWSRERIERYAEELDTRCSQSFLV